MVSNTIRHAQATQMSIRVARRGERLTLTARDDGVGMSPERPVVRGTAQNPDVFFQAREACTPFHAAVPDVVQATMDRYAELTGRQYHLAEYHGAPDAERVIVLMGSGVGAVREAVDALDLGVDPAHGGAGRALDELGGAVEERVARRAHAFRGRGRRGRAQVGGEIGDGEVGLVPDA